MFIPDTRYRRSMLVIFSIIPFILLVVPNFNDTIREINRAEMMVH